MDFPGDRAAGDAGRRRVVLGREAGRDPPPHEPRLAAGNLSTTTLTERDGKTTLTLRWVAINATEEERKAFDGARESMAQGWGGTIEQLEAYLAKTRIA
jgi:uncharacterized protein YndB with AHSA1/START domain